MAAVLGIDTLILLGNTRSSLRIFQDLSSSYQHASPFKVIGHILLVITYLSSYCYLQIRIYKLVFPFQFPGFSYSHPNLVGNLCPNYLPWNTFPILCSIFPFMFSVCYFYFQVKVT